MKITDTQGISGSGKPKKTKKSGDGGAFDALLEGASETDETSSSAEAAPAAPLNAVAFLGLQEVSDESQSRQESLRQGRAGIDVLEDARRLLLLGGDEAHLIARMKRQQSALNAAPHDPALRSIIEDIDLRLAVEIAKREAIGA